eukprot:447481-Pelagomonas_calceolata.AAC.6
MQSAPQDDGGNVQAPTIMNVWVTPYSQLATHFTLVPACVGDIIPEVVVDFPCAHMRSCLRIFSRARAAALRRHKISSSSGGTPPEADDPAFLHCTTSLLFANRWAEKVKTSKQG